MSISIVLPNLRVGGAERVSIDLAREFTTLGHKVEFVLMQAQGTLLSEAEKFATVISLDIHRFSGATLPLVRYLRKHKPDAVIANMWPLTSVAVVARLLSRHHCRLLLLEHTSLSQQYLSSGMAHDALLRGSLRLTYPLADVVAAVSHGSAMDTARLSNIAPREVAVLHNPIPLRPWPAVAALSAADSLWDCARGKRILTVGTLKKAKNHALLLRAFALLASPEARLMLLGEGELERPLRAIATQLGIADRVIFAGFHSDPSPFYATSDLFVMTSDYEGFGNVIVEALGFGLRVVSTDCPSGPAEILENGRWGKLVPVGNAQSLAQAMTAALSEPVDEIALKRRAADFVPEIATRKYLELLRLS